MEDFIRCLMLPLSGPVEVAQAWANVFKSMSQVGLVNVIQQMGTNDPDTEERIVTQGFSYGSQLGRINDALQVLVSLVDAKDQHQGLQQRDREALIQFQDMVSQIERLKLGSIRLSNEGIDEFVHRMTQVKTNDAQLFQDVLGRIASLHTRLSAMEAK